MMYKDKIFDLVIFTKRSDFFNIKKEILRKFPPIKEKIFLSKNIWIGEINHELGKKIIEACEPPGYNFTPSRIYRAIYAFVREEPPMDRPLKWDSDLELQHCIALSRIIHPTTISFYRAARVKQDNSGTIKEIIPGGQLGSGTRAYVADTTRDWLSQEDGQKIKNLHEAYKKRKPGEPITTAMFHFEYASRIYDLGVRWTLVCTGLEALIHTDRKNSTRQFVKRVPKLLSEDNRVQINEDDAKRMYGLRSAIVHGNLGNGLLSNENGKLYLKMEKVLRATIEKAIKESDFADLLSKPDRIKKQWPI